MHQSIGQFATGREYEQPACIDVESANGYPSPTAELGQLYKNAGTPLGIVAGNDLTLRFVIKQHARQPLLHSKFDEFAVHPNLVGCRNLLPNGSWQSIDAHAASQYPFFDLASGSDPGLGKHLVKSLWRHKDYGCILVATTSGTPRLPRNGSSLGLQPRRPARGRNAVAVNLTLGRDWSPIAVHIPVLVAM